MKAMVLAAGLGTRLRPLTDNRPKALVEVAGRTLLEITLNRLRSFGIQDVIINVHHFADMVVDYLRAKNDFEMRIAISSEDVLLDTGGGLKKAAPFFLGGGSQDEPFVLHNVDVLSTIDLYRMVEFHKKQQALATLAVQNRETSRYLLFDTELQLCGRRAGREGPPELLRDAGTFQAFAFSGIHIISPRLLNMLNETGAFSIIASYLRLARSGQRICAFRADEYHWRDLGKPENIPLADQDLRRSSPSA
jgi:NDP-sugar pyrophosphorylase family protein